MKATFFAEFKVFALCSYDGAGWAGREERRQRREISGVSLGTHVHLGGDTIQSLIPCLSLQSEIVGLSLTYTVGESEVMGMNCQST